MKDWKAIQERYLRDTLPVRLGGLAANLARINSFSDHPDHRDVVERLLDESKFFIEWTASDAGLESASRIGSIATSVSLLAAQLEKDLERSCGTGCRSGKSTYMVRTGIGDVGSVALMK